MNRHTIYSGRGKTWVDNPAMMDSREISCVKYAASKLRRNSALDEIDPEEIRAITRNMRRESWPIPKRPPMGRNDESAWNYKVIRAYLEHFGSMWTGELRRAGIEMRSVAYHCNAMPDVEKETVSVAGPNRRSDKITFYSLKNRAQ